MVNAEVNETIHVPEGVSVTITGSTVKVKGKSGELARDFQSPLIQVTKSPARRPVHWSAPGPRTSAT
jgi:ribosomal protein L6P/L9E